MKFKQLKIMSWNVRGLGSKRKRDVVRNIIRSLRCDVVCIQETKLDNYDLSYVSSLLPSYFDRNCVMLYATGTARGCLIAWKR